MIQLLLAIAYGVGSMSTDWMLSLLAEVAHLMPANAFAISDKNCQPKASTTRASPADASTDRLPPPYRDAATAKQIDGKKEKEKKEC
jgi:hypothetical protein